MRNGEDESSGLFKIPEPLLSAIKDHYAELHCQTYLKGRSISKRSFSSATIVGMSKEESMKSKIDYDSLRIEKIKESAEKLGWRLHYSVPGHPSDFMFVDNNGDEISVWPADFPLANNTSISYTWTKIMREPKTATIYWLREDEGGRKSLPNGVDLPGYSPLFAFYGSKIIGSWSLLVEKISETETSPDTYIWKANIKFAYDGAPHDELKSGREFSLFEGARFVARGFID